MSSVKLENIDKNFGNIKALSNLNLEINDGEFFVLLGPTGAGKTTTLRVVAGLEKVDNGKIFFNEEDISNVQPAFRDTCYVFQQYSLYPHYTVYDNLAFPLRSPLRKLNNNEIDKDLFEIFIKNGVYKKYAEKYLDKDQIDAVDENALLS